MNPSNFPSITDPWVKLPCSPVKGQSVLVFYTFLKSFLRLRLSISKTNSYSKITVTKFSSFPIRCINEMFKKHVMRNSTLYFKANTYTAHNSIVKSCPHTSIHTIRNNKIRAELWKLS